MTRPASHPAIRPTTSQAIIPPGSSAIVPPPLFSVFAVLSAVRYPLMQTACHVPGEREQPLRRLRGAAAGRARTPPGYTPPPSACPRARRAPPPGERLGGQLSGEASRRVEVDRHPAVVGPGVRLDLVAIPIERAARGQRGGQEQPAGRERRRQLGDDALALGRQEEVQQEVAEDPVVSPRRHV